MAAAVWRSFYGFALDVKDESARSQRLGPGPKRFAIPMAQVEGGWILIRLLAERAPVTGEFACGARRGGTRRRFPVKSLASDRPCLEALSSENSGSGDENRTLVVRLEDRYGLG